MSSEWPSAEIQDVCSVGDGAHSKVERTESGILYLTSKNIGQGNLKLDKVDFISQESFAKLFPENSRATRRPQPGDVLIGIIGTFGNAYVYKDSDNFGFSSSIGILRPNKALLDSKFLYYVISSPKFKSIHSASDGGSVQGYTNIPTIKKLPIYLPPLRVQKQIGDFLGSLDDRIALLRETNATLEAIAQALFKSWFVDFDPVHANAGAQAPSLPAEIQALFPSRLVESPQGLIPEGWEVGIMQDLFVLQRGFDLPATERTEGIYPLIAASGPNGTHNKAMVKGPGVVTGRSGVLGKVFFTLEDFWPLNTTLWIKEFKRATPCYALEVLKRLDMLSFNAGSAVPSLNRNHIHGLPYLLPPSELIEQFEATAMSLHRKMHENNKQAESLVNLRDTLLPRLISGQLRLPDAEAALAEVG